MIDWSTPQPSYEELHEELAALRAELRYLREAYATLQAEHNEAHRVVDFIIESRNTAQ